MDTISRRVSARELRAQLSEMIGRVMYAGERIGVTRNGRLAVAIVGIEDLETLERLEMAQDVAAYDKAKAEDDGDRIALGELVAELD